MTNTEFETMFENFKKLHNNEGPFTDDFVLQVRDIIACGAFFRQEYINDTDRANLFNATPENVYENYYALFKSVLKVGAMSTYGPIAED